MDNHRIKKTRVGFLRIIVHEWTGMNANRLAERLADLVKRRISYPGEPGNPQAPFHWVISDYEEVKAPEGISVFHGLLVKIRDVAIEDVFNEKEWKVESQGPLENAAEEQIGFSFFSEPHILMH